jgi:chromosome segregation ATPase
MPKIVLGVLAIVAVAGWAFAIVYFNKSGDFGSKLATTEAERGKLVKALDLVEQDLAQHIEATGRLDQIGQQLSATEDQVAAMEGQIQAKRDELVVINNETELGKAELAKLDSELSERRASVGKIEQEVESAGSELERLRAEAEELKQKAALAQSEPLTEPILEPGATSEAIPAEAKPKETDRISEARRRFEIVDENDDGRIDQFEFRLKSIRMQDQLDANRDGFVTIDETLLSPEKFKLFDSDGDGKISPVEFTRAFPIIDTAGQGFITFEDYLAFIQATAK